MFVLRMCVCGAVVNAAYARALRNCPWVGQLWSRALRALERSGAADEQHEALYTRALSAGLQVHGLQRGAGLCVRVCRCATSCRAV
jgi:hypothetical protein